MTPGCQSPIPAPIAWAICGREVSVSSSKANATPDRILSAFRSSHRFRRCRSGGRKDRGRQKLKPAERDLVAIPGLAVQLAGLLLFRHLDAPQGHALRPELQGVCFQSHIAFDRKARDMIQTLSTIDGQFHTRPKA